jgi:hypothetical protein
MFMFPCTASPRRSFISTGHAEIRAILTWREGATVLVAFDAAPVAKVACGTRELTHHNHTDRSTPRETLWRQGGHKQALEMRWNFLGRWDMFWRAKDRSIMAAHAVASFRNRSFRGSWANLKMQGARFASDLIILSVVDLIGLSGRRLDNMYYRIRKVRPAM